MRPGRRSALALLLAPVLALGLATAATASDEYGIGGTSDRPTSASIPVTVSVPDIGGDGGPFEVSNAELRWSINHESGSGAYFGGCNFLMAGTPGANGNTGGSKVWTAADGFYRAQQDAVSVVRPLADGGERRATFATRCTDPEGETVTAANNRSTLSEVVVTGGTGTVDPEAGTATIRWTGTFTVVYYGGLTYWWASDPVLEVAADGTGTLRATLGGYGSSMDDMSKWERLPATTVDLARLGRTPVAQDGGFTVVPRYRDVTVSLPSSAAPQAARTDRNRDYWGSFPQSFVDFQLRTGQAAYWYSSGGERDWAKPAAPLTVSYDADDPVDRDTDTGTVPPPGTEMPVSPVPPAFPGARPAGAGGGGAADGGLDGGTAPAVNLRPAASLGGPSLDTTDPPPFYPAAQSATVGGGGTSGLIPALAEMLDEPGERLAAMSAGLLLATAGAVYGFRRGWLVLPGRG